MAEQDNYFTKYLENEEKTNRFADIVENSTFADIVAKKQEELGTKAQEKTADFVSQEINLEEGFDGDTLFNIGRLSAGDGNPDGFSFDSYETAKYDSEGVLEPYLGSVAPKDGSKRSKKYNLHRAAYGKKYGIPANMVSQRMLNEAGAAQAEAFKAALYEGQDPDSDTVSVDVRQDGKGYFGRPLITVRNPKTGKIINEVMNTSENNAMFYSKYNQSAYTNGVEKLNEAEKAYNQSVGKGFWDSAGKGLSSGIDNLQATGYGFAALLVDATGGNEAIGDWFLEQYLDNIEQAQANGANLPGIEELDWSNPTAVLSKLGSLIGEAMPSIALMLGTGGVGGLIAKGVQTASKAGVKKFVGNKLSDKAQALITKAVARGRTAGAYSGSNVMMTGGIYGDVASEGNRDATAILGSLAGGSVAAALEIIYPMKLMKKLGVGKVGNQAAEKALQKNGLGRSLRNFGKELSNGAVTEGTTEGLQFVIEESTQDMIKDGHLPDFKSKEFFWGVMNSVVAGLVPGATFSGSASATTEIMNNLQGDKEALKRNLEDWKTKANKARDTEAQGEGDLESEQIIATNVDSIESRAEELGVELDDTYAGLNTPEKALYLSNALNKIKDQQKTLPAGERNTEVTKATGVIESSLEQLNTGSAVDETGIKTTLVKQELERKEEKINKRFERLKEKFPQRTERYEAQQAKQIAKARQVAANKQGKISSRARRVNKAGTNVIKGAINSSISQMNKISEKLKNPNISSGQRKKLEAKRNQLGAQIDGLSKDSTGQRIQLPKAQFKKIDAALNSFKFKNKRVKTKTNAELSKVVVKAKKVFDKYIAAKDNDKLNVEEFEGTKTELFAAYAEINEALSSLIEDKKNTNDKDALVELSVQIASLQSMKENISKEFAKEQASRKKPTAKPKAQQTATDEDIDSLDIDLLNNGIDESTLGSINSAQKKKVAIRKTVKEKFKVVKEIISKATKNIKDVHAEIMDGTKKFKGINQYLLDAKNNEFEETQFDNFVIGLELKLKAFTKAKKIFDGRESNKDVFIDKDTYEVYRNRKDAPNPKNVWYVNSKSGKLITLLNAEVAYAKSIKVAIAEVLSDVDAKVKNKELDALILKNQQEIDKILTKMQGNTGSLDDVNKPKAKPKSKPKAKPTATNKPKPKKPVVVKPVVKKPTAAEVEEIILEEEVDIDDIRKPNKETRARRNKKLLAYQKRIEKLVSDLQIKKENLLKTLKDKGQEGVNSAPLNRAEIQREIDIINNKIKNHKLDLKNFINKSLTEKLGNHFLTKFASSFSKLRNTSLKVIDLFRPRDIERDSFFSKNENKTLDRKSIVELLKKVGLEYSIEKDGKKVRGKDYVYITTLLNSFDAYKKAFEKTNDGFYTKKDGTTPDVTYGLLAKEAYKLFLDKDGNMPDEVIFAMMLSSMHYSAINAGKSQFRSRFEIAELLYGDGKQADRLGQAEIDAWTNAGIFTKNASKDIGLEMLDLLNLKVDKDTETQFLESLAKIEEGSSFEGIIIKDANFRNQAAVSLGLLAIQTSRRVGIMELKRGSYELALFDNDSLLGLQKLKESGSLFIPWNTIKIKDDDILETFKENSENLKKIKGAESNLSDISETVVKTVQQTADNSFFKLNSKIKNLMGKLQAVEWIGKENELKLFDLLVKVDANGDVILNDALKQLIGYKNLDEQNKNNRDAVESANEEKIKDLHFVRDYYNKGIKGFYFRFKAQAQHRLRIDSNTINPQRSKIMRALFNPVGSQSNIGKPGKDSDADRAVFKLAVVQAFGYNIKTMEEAIDLFDDIQDNEDVIALLSPSTSPEDFQTKLLTLLNTKIPKKGSKGEEVNLVDGASTHLLEAITALTEYDEFGPFSTNLGIETDGITNGYAIGLLQFLDGTPEELKDALERVGIFVNHKTAKGTYEKFINSGKDDVYQAFSRMIVEGIDSLGPNVKEAVSVLHGELLDGDNALTKFARDLAKNPVMISNYGAGVQKVLKALIGKIVPDMYDKLAKLQTQYNNGTEQDKEDALAAVQLIQTTLLNLSETRTNAKTNKTRIVNVGASIDLVGRLKTNKLYNLTFSDTVVEKIENYFSNVYQNEETKLIGNALDTLLGPIKASREIIIKVIEAEFFVFYSEFEKQTKDFPATNGTNVAIRMHIAAELANELMPRMSTPWGDPKNQEELIQLIKQVDATAGRIQISTKPFNNQRVRKVGKDFTKLGQSTPESILGTSNAASDFAAPSVAAAINMIQNMDSVVLGDLLDQKQQVLPIFDAVISPVKNALENAGLYNKAFLDNNLKHVMLEQTLEQYDKLLKNAEKFGVDIEAVNLTIQEESFEGKNLTKSIAKGQETLNDLEIKIDKLGNRKSLNLKQRAILEALSVKFDKVNTKLQNDINAKENLRVGKFRETLVAQIKTRKDNLAALIKTYGSPNTWVVSQMYLPESILDPRLKPKVIAKPIAKKVGTKIVRVKTALTGSLVTQKTIDGFKGAKDAAIKLSEAKGETAYIRAVAKMLIPLLDDNTVVSSDFDKYGRSSPQQDDGTERSYSRNVESAREQKAILIYPEAGTAILLHELIHAASQTIVKTKSKDRTIRQNNAVKQMWKVREDIKKEYEKDRKNPLEGLLPTEIEEMRAIDYLLYGGIENMSVAQKNARKRMSAGYGNPEGLRDSEALAEFLTQTLTSESAQRYLKKKKSKNGSLWSNLVISIRNLLGLKESSLLDDALSISIEGIQALSEEDNRSQGDLFDNTDKISEIVADEIMADGAKAFKDILEEGREDTLSSIDNIVDAELKEVFTTNSLRDNLTAIFDKLGLSSRDAYLNKGDQQAQEGHLQRVLTDIIAKAGVILDDTTVTLNESSVKAHGEANIKETSVNVNFNKFRPESYSEQTAQEVYVHELLHILTRFALTKNSRLREKLEMIRDQVKTEIEKEANPYELFLRKDANGNVIYLTDKESEIAAAKAQYNYLFGDKVPADAVLDEFLAYSLTNKFMVEKLNNMESKVIPLWSKDPETNVVEKIVQLFTEILDRISGVLSGKTKPVNVEQQIFELTKDIVAVNQSKRDELARALKFNKIGAVIDKGNSAIQKFAEDVASGAIKKGSDAYIKAVDRITKDGKLKGFLYDVLYDTKLIAYFGSSYKDFVDNHPKVQEKLNVVFRNIKPNTLKNLSSLKADLFGGVDQDFIKLLYKSHNEVDSNRREYKELTKESLQKVFKDYDSMTNIEKESLTKVFLKTDLSVLVQSGEFTVEEVMVLIQDDKALDAAVLDYRKKLNINKNSHYRLQTSQLAQYMIKGKNNSYNQYLNATNIYNTGSKNKRAYDKSRKAEEIRDLDIYISMLALRDPDVSNAKTNANTVITREFEQDSTHNGIHGLINLHTAFKTQSLEEGFNNNPTLMSKGYISTITDPDMQISVEPDDEASRKEMKRRGYTYISQVDGLGATPWALYVIKNNPELTRTKGIISMTSKQFKGTSLKEIFSRNQDTKNSIMDSLNKFERAQTKAQKKGKLSPKYTAVPVVDEELNIVDYRITLTHSLSEKHLGQELSFDEVLPTMFSQLEDKTKSEKINEDAIKLLYRYGKDNQKNNPSKFVNILDKKYQKEYFQPLPKNAKFQISKFATINKKTREEEFWVERGYLDTVFGYVNPSISNMSFFNNRPISKRYAKITEKLVKEMVSLAVVNVVIKIPIVPAVNFTSNFVTSMLYGVPPTYLIKTWREGILELKKYKKDAKTLKLLDIEILSNPKLKNDTATQKKREILVKRVKKNPVSGFVDAGLFTSITEDINQNEFTYRNKAFNRIKKKGNKLVSGKVFDIANHAYLGEHTAIFKASMQFLQVSDFIARYALYKHQVEVKGIDENKAWKTMVETFVNYDQPLNRFVAYGNDVGAILFVKYWLRIQRAGLNLIKEKPLNVGLLFASNGLLNLDIATILDSNLLTGNFMPTLGGFEKIFEEVLIPPGLEILAGEGLS